MKNKGNYYKWKTKRWFQEKGYFSEYLERYQRIFKNGKVIFIKRDIVGADGFSMNDKEIIFWQCKLNRKNVAEGIKTFQKYTFPPNVLRWIVIWEPRKSEPEIVDLNELDTNLSS